MVRVLHCVNNMHRAGLETMIMNYYRNIDRTKIQFDFLMHREERSDYDDEIEALGGKIYRAPRLYPQNYPAYFRFMKRFFADHPEYQIVHSHIDAMSYLPLSAAKKAGVPIRIAHSHNTAIDMDFKYPLKQYFRWRIGRVTTNCLACGRDAGKFLFKKNDVTVIPNAIDADSFLYDEETRSTMRCELGIQDRFVVGHIGRFSKQKNHSFLLDVFYEIQKSKPEAILLLIGTGEMENSVKEKAERMQISDKVLFLGVRSDVAKLYAAMDVFLMPSLYEGIPVVGIEAQFSDLSCFFSTGVPEEVAFSKNCLFLELKLSARDWANVILLHERERRKRAPFLDSCYRIENSAQGLQQYYFNLLTERGCLV